MGHLREVEGVSTEEAMIEGMASLAEAKRMLSEREGRAKKHLEMVKHNIVEDLAPLREEVEALKESLRNFITEENGGKAFNVPGLGTAYVQKRSKVQITDEEEFAEYFQGQDSEVRSMVSDPAKFNRAKARQYALGLAESGEMVPGSELIEQASLVFRDRS